VETFSSTVLHDFSTVTENTFDNVVAVSTEHCCKSFYLSHWYSIWNLAQTSENWNERTLSLGSKSKNGVPYFYSILPQIGTHI